MARVIKESKEELIDYASGELVESKRSQTYYLESEPPFVKLYFEDLGRLFDMPKGANAILLSIVKRMQFDNKVILISDIKKEIAKEAGVAENTVKNTIEELKRKGILIPKARAIYYLDPKLFGRGEWANIKNLRVSISYEKNRREIVALVEKETLSVIHKVKR